MSVKISELPVLDTLADNDVLAGVDTSANVTKKVAISTLKNYIDTNTQYTAGTNIDITNNVISAPNVYSQEQTNTKIASDISGKEDKSNKTIALSSSSTNTQYPGAKVVYDNLKDLRDSQEESEENLQEQIDMLNTIYNVLPTIEEEDTSMTLDGTAETKFKKLDLKGNTSQTTYSGKNLFDYVEAIASSKVSKSIVNDEMIIKRKEESGGGYVAILVSNLEIGENYTMTCDGRVYVYRGAVYSEVYDSVNNAKNGWSFEADQTSYTIAIIINSNEIPNVGDTMNCGKVQLEKGSTATSFEPFVGGFPSPSPSYPQPVNVVSGSNQIIICKENFAEFGDRKDTTKYTYISYQADNIDVEKTTTGGSFYASFVLHIPTGGRYKFSGEVLYGTQSFYIYSDKLYGTTIKSGVFSQGTISYSYEFPKAGTYYLGLDGSTVRKYGVRNFICVPSSSTITTYQEYDGISYPIDLPVKNLLDKNNANILNAFINPTGHAVSGADNTRTLYISCKPNTAYTVSKTITSRFIIGTATSNEIGTIVNTYASDSGATHLTVTSGANDTYLFVFYYNGSYDTLTPQQILDTIQIEEGSKANSYTPYGTTPIELCKIGNYQDYIYKDSDKWYLHKEMGKGVLDGSESWNYYTDTSKPVFWTDPTTGTKKINYLQESDLICYCDYFQGKGQVSSMDNVYDLGNNVITFRTTYKRLVIRDDSITSASDFGAWLSSNNIILYYVLATPTNTEITYQPLIDQLNAIEKAQSKENQTNIMQNNNDSPFIIGAEAILSLKNVLDRVTLLES